jgi:hypothetical protein
MQYPVEFKTWVEVQVPASLVQVKWKSSNAREYVGHATQYPEESRIYVNVQRLTSLKQLVLVESALFLVSQLLQYPALSKY